MYEAITDARQGDALSQLRVVICGVNDPVNEQGQPGEGFCQTEKPGAFTNEVRFIFGHSLESDVTEHRQYTQLKHHRWQVDANQIYQYGISAKLDPGIRWWEANRIDDRELYVFSLTPWLTFCTVICEDLARQDPIGPIIRAIGPNLVIGLLADGPQLTNRWSSRYATVLADDPGSSVLTVTSLGFSKASCPNFSATPQSNVVALWRDAATGRSFELPLPDGATGLGITLTREERALTTVDNRTSSSDSPDRSKMCYLRLGACVPINT